MTIRMILISTPPTPYPEDSECKNDVNVFGSSKSSSSSSSSNVSKILSSSSVVSGPSPPQPENLIRLLEKIEPDHKFLMMTGENKDDDSSERKSSTLFIGHHSEERKGSFCSPFSPEALIIDGKEKGCISLISAPPSASSSNQQSPTGNMPPKTIQRNDYEFDGTTVLCRVCGDKASGFHYGVHSCEGCKGFFRRSIQQKIQYRPCTKNQQCSILRINRNRCQYCRLKKCIAVGMSRDAVRFGRVPKREKAKILAAMQKVNAHSLEKALNVVLEDETNLMNSIVMAHEETCDYTRDKVMPLLETARSRPIYAQCPQMTCPLNPLPPSSMTDPNAAGTNRIMEDFSERFSPAIHGVVEFAKRIPGFGMLSQEDQVTLLKAGVFEVLLVRLACMFDSQTNSMVCINGLSLRRDSLHSASNARFLLDSMFEFAERLNSLRLTDQEIGLFCAVVVIAPDRPGLRNIDLVQKINKRLEEVLQKAIASNLARNRQTSHQKTEDLFTELTKKIPDLRTLNALHSEKLLGKSFGVIESSTTASINNQNTDSINRMDATSTTSSTTLVEQSSKTTQPATSSTVISIPPPPQQLDGQSTSPDRWSSLSSSLIIDHFSPNSIDADSNNRRSVSPPTSHHDSWNDSKDGVGSNFGSPRSISSGVSSEDSLSRKGSISSVVSSGQPSAKFSYINSYVRGTFNSSSGIDSSNHSDECVSARFGQSNLHHSFNTTKLNHHHHQQRTDSPTDSGIESGKEHCMANTPTTSVCSSPQSVQTVDDPHHHHHHHHHRIHKDSTSDSESGASEKHESIDDMPVLKRALQAPPLVNTNKLMDEAYRHHKKFRAAARRDTEPHSPSTTTNSYRLSNDQSSVVVLASSTPTGVITSHSSQSLASTHSTLLKTLEQPSRYMNEQQLKRTDLIHNIIMNTEAVMTPAHPAPSLKDSVTSYNTHHYQSSSEQHQQQSPQQQQVLLTFANKDQVPAGQVTVVYPSGYTAYPASCPFTGRSSMAESSSCAAQSQQPSMQYLASPPSQSALTCPYRSSPPLLLEQSQTQAISVASNNSGTASSSSPLLVIGTPLSGQFNSNAAVAPSAHSPRQTPFTATTTGVVPSNHHPYSYLQRCLTATTAPSLSNHSHQTAADGEASSSSSNETDQPLNLSKKPSSLSPSTSSTINANNCSTLVLKMEVDVA